MGSECACPADLFIYGMHKQHLIFVASCLAALSNPPDNKFHQRNKFDISEYLTVGWMWGLAWKVIGRDIYHYLIFYLVF